MPVHQESKLEFGADSVRSADQNRMGDSFQIQFKKSSEAADL